MAFDVASHPARWTGAAQSTSTAWVHSFSTAEIDELRSVRAEGCPVDGVVPLPILAPVLRAWLDELTRGRGFVLACGLPVHEMSADEISAAYLALGSHLGITCPQNVDGDLLGHVRDDGSDPNDITVRRYRTRLEQPFHTDGADLVGLLCLHQSRVGGESRIVSSVTVYDEVARRRPDLEPLFHEPWFFDTFGQSEAPWFSRPLLVGSADTFSMFYIRWYIESAQRHPDVPRLRPDQVELLDLIDALADDPSINLQMQFEPGDIQLLSNHTILHARNGYEDFDEPERKRHLLRLWLSVRR